MEGACIKQMWLWTISVGMYYAVKSALSIFPAKHPNSDHMFQLNPREFYFWAKQESPGIKKLINAENRHIPFPARLRGVHACVSFGTAEPLPSSPEAPAAARGEVLRGLGRCGSSRRPRRRTSGGGGGAGFWWRFKQRIDPRGPERF